LLLTGCRSRKRRMFILTIIIIESLKIGSHGRGKKLIGVIPILMLYGMKQGGVYTAGQSCCHLRIFTEISFGLRKTSHSHFDDTNNPIEHALFPTQQGPYQ
jgi:hypothetical protein